MINRDIYQEGQDRMGRAKTPMQTEQKALKSSERTKLSTSYPLSQSKIPFLSFPERSEGTEIEERDSAGWVELETRHDVAKEQELCAGYLFSASADMCAVCGPGTFLGI